MERIKKIIFTVFLLLCIPLCGWCLELSDCTKTFPVGFEKLYYLTLAGVNDCNYNIDEVQSKNGYVVFNTGGRKFLAAVIYVSSSKSMLRITPYNGNYEFDGAIPQNLFNYVIYSENIGND